MHAARIQRLETIFCFFFCWKKSWEGSANGPFPFKTSWGRRVWATY